MVAGRKRLEFTPQPVPYHPVETVNVPPEIAAVVANHHITLKEAKSKDYSYIDLLDDLEIIQCDNENRRRDFKYHDSLRRLNYG